VLMTLSIGVVLVGILISLTPIGPWFGFVVPPLLFFVFLAVAVVAYLAVTELVKHQFYLYWMQHQRRSRRALSLQGAS
jgi:P-type Mg2+ transporter